MPRPPRILDPTGVFHITCRGNNKERIFRDNDDRAAYLALLDDTHQRLPFALHHYAIMDDHVHLVVRTRGIPIPEVMKRLNYSYTHFIKRKYKFVGQLWQGRYRENYITSDTHILTSGLYVELSPVRERIVKHPIDFPWSSYGFYAEGMDDRLITPNPLYETLGDTPVQRQSIYRLLAEQWRARGKLERRTIHRKRN